MVHILSPVIYECWLHCYVSARTDCALGVDVTNIGCYAWCQADIVESKIGDAGVELEKQR